MMDTRYTSIYTNAKSITTTREQLSAEVCKSEPSYVASGSAKVVGKGIGKTDIGKSASIKGQL